MTIFNKINLDPSLTSYTKMNSQWITALTKSENYKTFRRKIFEKPCEIFMASKQEP